MPEVLQLFIDRIHTPIGELLLVADAAGKLRAVDWSDYEPRMLRLLRLHYGKKGYRLEPAHNPHGLRDAMDRYFAGDVEAINDIPVQTSGTPFQRSVWKELRKIPSGAVVSYGKLAGKIARPTAVRAVGLPPMAPIRSASWCRAIGSSDRTGPSPDMAEAWSVSDGCSNMSESTRRNNTSPQYVRSVRVPLFTLLTGIMVKCMHDFV